jgi:hypothetical protein
MFACARPRAILVALFVLLLGMQHEVQVHALQHLGATLHPRQDQGLQTPVADAPCVECALLAGGASVIGGSDAAQRLVHAPAEHIIIAIASRSLAAPSSYSTRAPPSLL